ncbi:TrbC/VirB2 family protein [Bacillus testis]|uniref:TrbC/VirB2 family protein n=1 Tax=Bacillus testis TaxID=1622072 RepID=UPI00067E9408|nr:TrbC/VirB2 family protein [Bacillus testis]
MRGIQTISFNSFMSGEYKQKKPVKKQRKTRKIITRIATSAAVPLVFAKPAFAATTGPVIQTGAAEWMGEKALQSLAHVLDPIVDVLVALSFPVASVIIVGALFFFMFGNAEKAWSTIQNAGLGYVLIQVSPLILNVLKQIGNAV